MAENRLQEAIKKFAGDVCEFYDVVNANGGITGLKSSKLLKLGLAPPAGLMASAVSPLAKKGRAAKPAKASKPVATKVIAKTAKTAKTAKKAVPAKKAPAKKAAPAGTNGHGDKASVANILSILAGGTVPRADLDARFNNNKQAVSAAIRHGIRLGSLEVVDAEEGQLVQAAQ